jgi:hypothetical protein
MHTCQSELHPLGAGCYAMQVCSWQEDGKVFDAEDAQLDLSQGVPRCALHIVWGRTDLSLDRSCWEPPSQYRILAACRAPKGQGPLEKGLGDHNEIFLWLALVTCTPTLPTALVRSCPSVYCPATAVATRLHADPAVPLRELARG